MSGKSYTLREMKLMVDYLTTNSLYGETRGRKMWMDFANTNLTMRTWQSLKETFLKRVLPDITNPYYRLDPDQIMSFKRGLDLTQKDKKLELVPLNETNKNDKNPLANGDKEQPSTSKNYNEENATGEDTQCSKIVHDRASTETLILDTCYQTAEDIQRDLESSGEEQDAAKVNNKSNPAVKSVRDFIEYSEPLSPMLQEVLDDFATDEDCSDTEPPMQIDENYVAQGEISDAPVNVPASQSILAGIRTDHQGENATIGEKENVKKTNNMQQDAEHNEESIKPTDGTPVSQLDDVMVLVDEALAKDLHKELNTEKEESQNNECHPHESSSALTDSLLPNNQEAVESGTFGVDSSVLPTPHVSGRNNTNKNKDPAVEIVSNEKQGEVDAEGSIEIDSNEEKPNDNEHSKQKPIQNTESTKLESPNKPYVSDDKIHEIHSDSSTSKKELTSQGNNPCLQSVSLYAEQMVTKNYSDSDHTNKENFNDDPKPKEDQKKDDREKNEVPGKTKTKENEGKNYEAAVAETKEKVILLNSCTSSESVDDSVSDKPLARSLKMQKDKKLASVFGFSNGGAVKGRRFLGRKRTTSHRSLHSRHSGSDSSGWTSTSDSEYVSPPHGRRNRYARKYLKPHSARVMSLDEEGGLFVMLGKKIYPLVKDGKALKNYVTFLPESDPEEDESYWKSKYIDERKLTANLKKKLGQVKSNGVLDKEDKESFVSLSSSVSENLPRVPSSRPRSINGSEIKRRDSEIVANPSKQDTLKIKFSKNDQEVQLEGHWQHINPVLAQVVSMFHKEPTEKKQAETVTSVELSSGNTTPIVTATVKTVAPSDKGVHDKINEMESKIFKEIEEKDVIEAVIEQQDDGQNNQEDEENDAPIENTAEEVAASQVTPRKKRGRPKKEPMSASTADQAVSRPKKAKKSIEPIKTSVETLKALDKDSTPSVARLTRSPKKLLDGITETKRARKSTAKAKPETPIEVTETPLTEEPDDEVRYKFPSPAPERRASMPSNTKNNSPKNLPNMTSPDSLSHHSVYSSQGYQDSDTSPFNIGIRRRRRLSISTLSIKGRKIQRKKRSNLFPLLRHICSESSNKSFNITSKSTRKEQTTFNSEVYKSESYQLLMPRTKDIMKKLESIEETNSNDNGNLMDRLRNLRDEILQATVPTEKNDGASSSNLSLPLSPELSIVENLSISQSVIPVVDDYPTINEMQANTVLNTCNNKYRLAQVDVSMPLMAQECFLQESYRKHIMSALSNLSDAPNSAGRNLANDFNTKMSIASDSVLKTISGINISSDSLDTRLEQLLLESAQKPTNQEKDEQMEVDTTVKKKGSRKRCSTPHKKKIDQNKRKSSEPIIEEESKAHCARRGRRSCPPTINIVYYEDEAPDNLHIDIQDKGINVTTVNKGKRIKKDIIKVKIGKPKKKSKKKTKSKTPNVSQTSSIIEGDNESGVFLQVFEDSGELIHNHSETCLELKECVNDSVEYIETATKSIISIYSSSLSAEDKDNTNGSALENAKSSPELFCGNAHCATHFNDAQTGHVKSIDSSNPVYFTPFMSRCNSMMTEDLSDRTPVSKSPEKQSSWLLCGEESNSNYLDVQDCNDAPSYGANLKQLFPITCAVPDLSTITETSEKNDSQKES